MNCTRARVIGLTGQSGAGKTTVSRVFSQNGFAVIDADIISREVTEKGQPCLTELSEAFGSDIINSDGTLNRKRLGSIVFSDREKLRQLNGIIYPYIIYRIISRIDELSEKGRELILLDAPTLFEANADDLCDLIISVTADESIRMSRIIARDNITPEAAKKRFESQYSEHFFVNHSDFVIINNKTPDVLAAKAEEVAGKIKEYYNAKANG
ncbi:MAG: dephospho-CoA kinase [Oscillospiraceae bacterium]|nr:dephospho-CoA kinase [Oscillospiraceae bacterium]MCI7499590.1 dephospho-CoA kinase [Oscillospiraceae bacterium]MDD7279120.1 dephospho-CoA kinase [Oscillospiraceae bacterium]MDY2864462.1 dephospho-CoA kinase [Oscillospiraceae bacterium]